MPHLKLWNIFCVESQDSASGLAVMGVVKCPGKALP